MWTAQGGAPILQLTSTPPHPYITLQQSTIAKIPSTGFYHSWALFPAVATVPFARAGLAVLTVNITGIDDFKEGSQFGNVLYIDFQKLE